MMYSDILFLSGKTRQAVEVVLTLWKTDWAYIVVQVNIREHDTQQSQCGVRVTVGQMPLSGAWQGGCTQLSSVHKLFQIVLQNDSKTNIVYLTVYLFGHAERLDSEM